MAKVSVSLNDLDLKKKCEEGFKFEYVDSEGKETGIYFTVIGAHSPKVQQYVNKKLNERRRQDAMQQKRGKDVEIRSIEDDIQFGVEMMSIRLIAWEGITEPCTPENALKLCESNPSVVDQVRDASESLANFTKSK